jgi:hypothetical protein
VTDLRLKQNIPIEHVKNACCWMDFGKALVLCCTRKVLSRELQLVDNDVFSGFFL